MNDGLVQEKLAMIVPKPTSLNPYCSGRWSRTDATNQTTNIRLAGLNPYCSGKWSRTSEETQADA